MPFSGESRPAKSTSGGCGLLGDLVRDLHPARDHAHLLRAEVASGVRKRVRGTDCQARPAQDRTGKRPRSPRQLDVRAPELDDERAPESRGDPAARKPVRMDQVRLRREPLRRASEVPEHRREHRRAPRLAAQVADDPGAVRDAVVRERRGRDDVDVDPAPTELRDRLAEEVHRRIALVARVRRRQHQELHF